MIEIGAPEQKKEYEGGDFFYWTYNKKKKSWSKKWYPVKNYFLEKFVTPWAIKVGYNQWQNDSFILTSAATEYITISYHKTGETAITGTTKVVVGTWKQGSTSKDGSSTKVNNRPKNESRGYDICKSWW